MSARPHDGRSVRILNLIDEYTRECLMVRAERRWSSTKVIGALADVMKGVPEHLRSDNGPSSLPRTCASGFKTQVQRRSIWSRTPCENGYGESFLCLKATILV